MKFKFTKNITMVALGGVAVMAAGCSDDFDQGNRASEFRISARTAYLRTGDTNLKFSPAGGDSDSRTLHVEAYNSPWVIKSQADWVKVSPSSGTGTRDVTVTVEPNPVADMSKHTMLTLETTNSNQNGGAIAGVTVPSWYISVDQERPAAFLQPTVEQVSPGIARKLGGTIGSTLRVAVNANCEWQVIDAPEWVSYNSDAEGITLTATGQNTLPESRTGHVIIEYDRLNGSPSSTTVAITQDILEYNIPEDYHLHFDRQGERKVLKGVRMEGDWYYGEGSATWVAAWSTRNDDGTYDITVRTLENTDLVSGTSRTAYVPFYSRDKATGTVTQRALIHVEQDPYFFEFSGTALNEDGSIRTMQVGSRTARIIEADMYEAVAPLYVRSNCDWMFGSYEDWVNIGSNKEYNFHGPTHGIASNRMNVNIWPNKTAQPRSGLFHISYPNIGGKHEYVNVIQRSASLTVGEGEDKLTVSASGGSFTLDIEGHGAWSVGCDSEWVHITSPTSGVFTDSRNKAVVTFDVDPSFEQETRSCKIMFWLAGIQKTYTIVQMGFTPISVSTIVIDPDGEKKSKITLDLISPWQISTDCDWLEFSQTSGSGSQESVDLFVSAKTKNPHLNKPRSAKFILIISSGNENHSYEYSVIQDAYSLNVTVSSTTFPGEASPFNVYVTGSIPINKQNIMLDYPDWIQLNNVEETSSYLKYNFTCTKNSTFPDREGWLKVWHEEYPEDIISERIFQRSAGITIDPTYIEVSAANQIVSITVSSSSKVSYNSTLWAYVTKIEGDRYDINVMKNQTGSMRTIYITFKNDYSEATLTIVQNAI